MKDMKATPALVVDEAVVRKNIEYMGARASQYGLGLRPHIKTHKTLEVAAMQVEAGAAGITCAKVSEAEVYAEAGFEDIFLAYPVVGGPQLARMERILKRCSLSVAFDSLVGAERLDELGQRTGRPVEAVMIVNSGGGRDGVASVDAAAALGRQVRQLDHLNVIGVMTHEGHAYKAANPSDIFAMAESIGRIVVDAAENLRHLGFDIRRVSTGATPTCWLAPPAEGVTEWRPGTYIYNDVQEWQLGIPLENCALRVQAMVVSQPAPGRFIIDAGAKTLSQAQHPDWGLGMVNAPGDGRVVSATEEHGIVEAEEGQFRIGDVLEIVPIHVCTAVNLHDWVWVKRDSGRCDHWNVAARGCVV